MRIPNFMFLPLSILLAAGLMAQSGCSEKTEAGPPPMEMKIPVVGFKALKQTVSDKISLVGTLEANDIVEIKSEIDGAVEDIKFEEGQQVKKGDLLVLINQRKLNAALAQAEANLKLAETTSERYKSLIESGAISRQEYEEAVNSLEVNKATVDLTQAQLKDSTIVAPFDGVMGERRISVGQYISKGTTLSFLISQDPMKANFRVAERYLSRLKENQPVEMRIAAYPDENFAGEVYFIDSRIDELTRTALMKAKVSNPQGKLRHGMFTNLQLTVDEKQNAIVIPETALILRSDMVFVDTVAEDSTVAIKPVKVGIRFPGFVEITEGLSEGEIVVVEGYQKLAPGAKAQVRFEEEEKNKEQNSKP